MQNGTDTWKDSLVGSQENVFIPYYPAIAILGVDPNEFKTCVHTKTCAQIFPAALFLIDKT